MQCDMLLQSCLSRPKMCTVFNIHYYKLIVMRKKTLLSDLFGSTMLSPKHNFQYVYINVLNKMDLYN